MKSDLKVLIIIGFVTLALIGLGVYLLGSGESEEGQVAGTASTDVLLSNTNHTQGDPQAPVKIVEFADFQCPACATAYPIVKNVLSQNQNKVYFVFRHYPLSSHKNAKVAARAAEAAANQDKFWQMYDLLFENQKDWAEASDAKDKFEEYAEKIGLDLQKYNEDLASVDKAIEQDYADGNKVGVNSTPTFFINGQKYSGVIQQTQFQQLIDNTQ